MLDFQHVRHESEAMYQLPATPQTLCICAVDGPISTVVEVGEASGSQTHTANTKASQQISKAFQKKCDRMSEGRGFSLFLFFLWAYRVGGVVLENCVVVFGGLIVPFQGLQPHA